MEIEITYTELAGLIATVIFLIGMLGIVMVLGNNDYLILKLYADEYSYVFSLSDRSDMLTVSPVEGSKVIVEKGKLVLEKNDLKAKAYVLSSPIINKNDT